MLVRTLALMLATTALMVPTSAPASAAPDHFTPRAGATFNSPVGSRATQRKIFRRLIRSINSTPRGSEIRIFTWNFLTSDGKDALLRAQRRGVKVQLLMDNKNNVQIENQPFRRLRAGLHRNNKRFAPHRRSWARTCTRSCRGKGGSAHSKFFLFSKVGKARRVVMHGSANLTVASTTNQWNDLYTHVGHRGVWKFANKIFDQAARDRKAKRPYATRSFKNFRLLMFPNVGKGARDPVMGMLNRVKCRGATNTANGRTRIRIAPDVIRQPRGMRLAKKVRSLWQDGCNIRIGYTVVGIDIGRMLRSKEGRRGAVPMKHLVQDFNGDGQFDNYFHLKSMTIVGNYGGDRSAHALLNGSANWSGVAKASDENLGIYRAKGKVLRYEKHINYWYHNFPSDGRAAVSARTSRSLEPQLVFGSGKDAVYEDGSPVGHDPFAGLEMD